MMGNCQVRFWRAVEGATSSLTLLIVRKVIQRAQEGLPHKQLNKQVSTTLKFDLSRVSRGVLTRPQKLKFWSAKKTQSNGVLTHCGVSF
ncbi:hypothetical protein [Crocosphaera sp.]|uniref:hypothetical protein n=1 Tax=Crocosphaera sp. TaxID=2729996 RepID=UPI0026129D96|nr:hypothetical protein [Crocosphaera sp.]MDJ0580933.1 hypothetical protein [Crocosphaera sp.]